MSQLSYQEKSLYGTLIAELLVYGTYFFFHHENSIGRVALMIVGIIILQVVIQGLIAALTRNRLTDERDKLIELRGYRAGYFAVVSLMVIGLGMLWFHSTISELPVNHMGLHFLSAFFGILVISDVVKTVTQIIAYRRGL
jgi:hypothetical protein